MLLGICGGADDIAIFERRLSVKDPAAQIGNEGFIFGYLLLTGEEGLARIEKLYLANPKAEDGATYAAILGVRYFWSYGNGKIAPARMQQSMRMMLDRPTVFDSAVTDLARLERLELARNADAALRDEKLQREIVETGNHPLHDCQREKMSVRTPATCRLRCWPVANVSINFASATQNS